MGKGGAVLTVGRPLPWQEAKDKLTYVRQHGVDQFIQHYRRHETKQRDTLLYGDEIEYGLFKLSSDGASLSLRGDELSVSDVEMLSGGVELSSGGDLLKTV